MPDDKLMQTLHLVKHETTMGSISDMSHLYMMGYADTFTWIVMSVYGMCCPVHCMYLCSFACTALHQHE